jgi:anti-sigma regulatory factor (Ser/Thr protein kinase)
MASRTAAARKTASTAEAQDSPHRDELADALLTGAAIAMHEPATAGEETVMAQARRRVFPGRHEQVAHARRFVGRVLAGCPVTDEATLCVSELATNALLHTGSGKGGKFEVIVQHGESWARVAVWDEGSLATPAARALDAISENGRGLGMVALVADRWGQRGDEYGRTVWFELRWDAPEIPVIAREPGPCASRIG